MTEFTEKHERMLSETHDTVITIKTVLLGANGRGGLVEQVTCNTKRSSLNRVIIAAILGSGLLGGGIVGIIQVLK